MGGICDLGRVLVTTFGLAAMLIASIASTALSDQPADCSAACEAFSPTPDRLSACVTMCETAEKLQSGSIDDCNTLNGTLRDVCFSRAATDQDEPAYCAFVMSSTINAACFTSIAVKRGDEGICDNITEPVFKTSCTENFD
jgi:hypothetical protein